MTPLQIREVAVRNAVSDAVTAMYGPNWPWNNAFVRTLPNPQQGYNGRKDLLTARQHHPTTGKVIPELKFVFLQMFTGRFDGNLWNSH